MWLIIAIFFVFVAKINVLNWNVNLMFIKFKYYS